MLAMLAMLGVADRIPCNAAGLRPAFHVRRMLNLAE